MYNLIQIILEREWCFLKIKIKEKNIVTEQNKQSVKVSIIHNTILEECSIVANGIAVSNFYTHGMDIEEIMFISYEMFNLLLRSNLCKIFVEESE